MRSEAVTAAYDFTSADVRAVIHAKALAADAVERAGHGHPGSAISLMPAGYTLYQAVLRHDPGDPLWLGRDRFVLSGGHSCLVQYVQLFLAGYRIDLDDFRAFRTPGTQLPGHPEFRLTPGVEMTTGPLAQGLAGAVGMAMAARRERHLFDPEAPQGASPFDHTIWVLAGDGDIQEGVAYEACSLAGTHELGNLVVIYDRNFISIEGDTDVAFTEDVTQRFLSQGWHVQEVDWRANNQYIEDVGAFHDALVAAKAETTKPSLIILDTVIAWPCPTKSDSASSHGAKLGAEEVAGLKLQLGLDPEVSFAMPDEVLEHTRRVIVRTSRARDEWEVAYAGWRAAHPDRAQLLDRLRAGLLPGGLREVLPHFTPGKPMPTRKASGVVLNALASLLPELWGGSADLGDSNMTVLEGESSFLARPTHDGAWPGGPGGRIMHFGVREHAMGQIVNGIALHGLTRAFGATFLVFSDFMRPAIRAAALMQIGAVFVWSHDSIGVGEDGPTHQPIEQVATMRAIPGFDVVRPADANEVSWAWKTVIERQDRPAALILSRQAIPIFPRADDDGAGGHALGAGDAGDGDELLAPASGVAFGAYVLAEPPEGLGLDVLLIATGSEVQLALGARDLLARDAIGARVISAPCLEWFAEQDPDYQASVLPPHVRARVSVEAGLTLGWRDYVGDAGITVGIDHFGSTGSGDHMMRQYGFTPENVAAQARISLRAARGF